jgi:hypothetical protein
VSCRHDTRHGRAVPARHDDVSRRAAVPTMPCQTGLWARPSAHDTAHGPFTRVVPRRAAHGPWCTRASPAGGRGRRGSAPAMEGEERRRGGEDAGGGEEDAIWRWRCEERRRGAAVPAVPPCRAKVVSWARPAAHDLHGPSCRAGTGTLLAVLCRPWAVPKGRAVGRATGPWAICTPIVPRGARCDALWQESAVSWRDVAVLISLGRL